MKDRKKHWKAAKEYGIYPEKGDSMTEQDYEKVAREITEAYRYEAELAVTDGYNYYALTFKNKNGYKNFKTKKECVILLVQRMLERETEKSILSERNRILEGLLPWSPEGSEPEKTVGWNACLEQVRKLVTLI